MKKPNDKNLAVTKKKRGQTKAILEEFTEVSRRQAHHAVNQTLVDLYWNLGAYISGKVESAEWGSGVVEQLAVFLQREYSGMRGLSDKNLWRMMRFYETYRNFPKLSTVLREIPWSKCLAA